MVSERQQVLALARVTAVAERMSDREAVLYLQSQIVERNIARTDVKSQIDSSKRRAAVTKVYADVVWFNSINRLYSRLGAEILEIQQMISTRKHRIRLSSPRRGQLPPAAAEM